MKSRDPDATNHHITRRSFLGTTAAGSAVLLTGGLTSLFESAASAAARFPFVEATIPQLQAAMASGQLSSKELTKGYLQRIQSFNATLHAVIEVNPNAISIAQHLDNERRKGMVRAPCTVSQFSSKTTLPRPTTCKPLRDPLPWSTARCQEIRWSLRSCAQPAQ
jgi:hypothetical protein